MNILIFFLIPFLIYCINSYIIKNRYLLNFSGENYQKTFRNKKYTFYLGNFLILFLSIIFLEKDVTTFIFLNFNFCFRLFSDLKILSVPSRRLFYQSILIILFVYFFSNFETISTRVIFIDLLCRIIT